MNISMSGPSHRPAINLSCTLSYVCVAESDDEQAKCGLAYNVSVCVCSLYNAFYSVYE